VRASLNSFKHTGADEVHVTLVLAPYESSSATHARRCEWRDTQKYSSIKFSVPTLPARMAACSGVSPCLSTTFTFAPSAQRRDTITADLNEKSITTHCPNKKRAANPLLSHASVSAVRPPSNCASNRTLSLTRDSTVATSATRMALRSLASGPARFFFRCPFSVT
jgi:hypothetical protein